MCFVGDRFIVTVRRGEASPLAGLRHAARGRPRAAAARADGGAPRHRRQRRRHLHRHRRGDRERPRGHRDPGLLRRRRWTRPTIYRLKREVLEFRRAAVPLSRVRCRCCTTPSTARSTRPSCGCCSATSRDHLQAVIDHVESYDRLLTDILGAHLAQITVQQNNDMRKISAWVAIAAVPTMIAGIYGMNFDNMPELRWRYGYFGVARPHGGRVPAASTARSSAAAGCSGSRPGPATGAAAHGIRSRGGDPPGRRARGRRPGRARPGTR